MNERAKEGVREGKEGEAIEGRREEWVGCAFACVRVRLRSIPSALNYHSSTVCVFTAVSSCGCRVNSSPTTPPNGD